MLTQLRAAGIPWRGIAGALIQWRRSDGRNISADQLRSAYSRARAVRIPVARDEMVASPFKDNGGETKIDRDQRDPQPLLSTVPDTPEAKRQIIPTVSRDRRERIRKLRSFEE